MSERLFNTAQLLRTEDEVRDLINVYSKVEKESQEIKRHTKKYQPPLGKKQVSSQEVLRMVARKNVRPPSKGNNPKQSTEKKSIVPVQSKGNIKQRISHLKQQINTEQKSIIQNKKTTVIPSKEELQYNIFRFKMLGKRIADAQVSIQRSMMREGLKLIKQDWSRGKMLEAKFVLKRYKNIMRKYFNQLCKQTIILKLERQKVEHKAFLERQQMNQRTAMEFREFTLLRRGINSWKIEKERVRRQKKESERNQIIVESERENNLKSKLNNLLSKIRDDINTPVEVQKKEQIIGENNTIRQEFQQSMESRAQDWATQQDNIFQNHANITEQPPKSTTIPKKMTNDDLFKKRQELQLKNKQRKQALEKLKKEKQELKMKAEEQKKVEQQMVREQERKKNKEQHEKFLQKRKEEEERKKKQEMERKRMDQLYVVAERHNELRIMKYKGLVPWKKMMQDKREKLSNLLSTVIKVELSSHWRSFKQKYQQHSQQIQQHQQSRLNQASKYYQRKLKKQLLQLILTYNSTIARQQSLFLSHFRNTHCLKQMFSIWRKQIPHLKQENYHIELKQNKKIEQFRYVFLLKAGFEAFRVNKEDEQRERRILEHKIKIKQKMEEFKGKREQIDIDKLI